MKEMGITPQRQTASRRSVRSTSMARPLHKARFPSHLKGSRFAKQSLAGTRGRSPGGSGQGRVILGYKHYLKGRTVDPRTSMSRQSRSKGFPMRSSVSPDRMSRHQRLGYRSSASQPREWSRTRSMNALSKGRSSPLARTGSLRRHFG